MPNRRNLLSVGLYPKIVLVFMAALLPVLMIGSMIVVNGEKAFRREINMSLSSRIHFYITELNTAFDYIANLKREYIFDQDIQKFNALSSIMSDYDRRVGVLDIEKKMLTLKSSNAYIADAGLYLMSEHKVIYSNRIAYHISEQDAAVNNLLNRQTAPVFQWNGQLMMAERFPEGTYDNGSLPAYWLEIVLDRGKIESTLAQMLTESGGNAILSDMDGEWRVSGNEVDDRFERHMTELYKGNAEMTGQRVVTVDGRHYIAAYERSPKANIALTLYLPEEIVLKPLAVYQMWFRIFIATAIAIIFLFAYWIYLFLQRPLQRLVRAFRKVSEGAFDVQLKSRNRDEIAYFYEQFNRMMDTIQALIRDVYEESIRSQRAELKHLQAQINPHFLYNTYYRLHRMAQDEDTDNIKRYTQLLGDYLKYIARNAQEEATLRMEVDHARTYADILKMRFRDNLTVRWGALPAEAEHIPVPRLIVQPIVENAFIHGLEELDGHGILQFSAAAEAKGLTLVVEDNGDRLTDEQLSELAGQLRNRKDWSETTGLFNVHGRLVLKFGPPFGLRLSRSRLGGLRVEIHLPIDEEVES
ncbi:histidine kinase [Cohnella zeiphila]|uniref:Histidine kinase n=1 Tax=Cohnella zeiphila TaxID=2761120 RepID=A0A7X0ST38_9BACL|nr:histidine kinase [Cohnella zeiphila]